MAGHDGECGQPLHGRQIGGVRDINTFHGPMRVPLLYTE
jgi:hypothetical protein